ncbi:MAG: TetR/AcrR family transcriptional regulator [Saccharofermentans sp.]|nr:TetR/AcrR family transcriptional regulator [Saccharofermentans sp.]
MTREPTQKRSIEKKQRIKDAAFDLMAENGYHNTSSNEIAKKAGVSIGTFYSYFKDKKDLYEELVGDIYEYVISSTATDLNDPSDDQDPRMIAEQIIRKVLQSHYYKKDFQKEIASLSQQSDEFRMIEDRYRQHVPELFMGIIRDSGLKLRVADPEVSARIVMTTVESVIHETVFNGDGSQDERVISELTDLVFRYLFV